MILRYLIDKEFRQFFRNPFLPKLMVGFPCLAMLIFPWVANMEVKDIKTVVVDADRTQTSQRLVGKLAASSYFKFADEVFDYKSALNEIEHGRADLILEIPAGFEKELENGSPARAMITVNTLNGTKGALASNYMAGVLGGFSEELRVAAGVAAGSAAGVASGPAIELIPRELYNPRQDYKIFMIPALMVMLLTMLCGLLPAINLVAEKEKGTIEQINVTPVSRFSFLLAKLSTFWIIGFVVLSLSLLVVWPVYGLVARGSLWSIYFCALLFIVAISAMGLVISNYSATMQQAMFLMVFFVVVMMLMSGLFTPVDSMPGWAKAITVANPLKYFIECMRRIFLKGSSLYELRGQWGALIVFVAVFGTWMVAGYRKKA